MANWVRFYDIDNVTPFKQIAWQLNIGISGDMWFSELSGLTTDLMSWSDGKTAEWGRFTYHRFNYGNTYYTCNFLPQYDSYGDGYGAKGTAIGYPQNYGYAARDNYFGDDLPTQTINGIDYYILNLEDWLNWVPLYKPYQNKPYEESVASCILVDIDLRTYTVTPSAMTFAASGGTENITIDFDDPWTASTQESWISLSQITGNSGTSIITVTVSENTGTTLKNGVITVTNGEKNVACTITQNKYPILAYCENIFRSGNAANKIMRNGVNIYKNLSIFYVDTNEIDFNKDGGTEQVVINSSKKWTATAPNWITLSSYSGRSGNITITVASADTSRDGNIVISNGEKQRTIIVNQTVQSYELDLNNGEWIANGEVEGFTLYESTNNGQDNTTYSCYLKFTGQSATLMVRTDGEDCCDYVLVDDFDTGSSFWSGQNQTHNEYHTVVCNYNTNGTHTIAIKYIKDGSASRYTDKGYFYIKEIA